VKKYTCNSHRAKNLIYKYLSSAFGGIVIILFNNSEVLEIVGDEFGVLPRFVAKTSL
jgi:hypothetical protein